jgi:hypothetical protein
MGRRPGHLVSLAERAGAGARAAVIANAMDAVGDNRVAAVDHELRVLAYDASPVWEGLAVLSSHPR